MKRLIHRVFCIGVVLIAPTLPTHAADYANPFTRDIKILADWFEGEFDNEEQIWFHRMSRAEGEAPERIHTAHLRLDLPAFGDYVFYVEEYIDNDPSKIIRQRFVTFESDLEEGAIRMQQGFFKNPEKYVGAYRNPSKFSKLKPKDVFFMRDLAPDNECDVFWRRIADQFEGSMKEKACKLGTDGRGPARYSVHDMILSQNKYWRVDASLLEADDSLHRGTPLDEPHKMRRARLYVCDYFFYGGEGAGSARTQQKVEGLIVHSQGGSATAVRESDGASFEIMMREKEYPYYDTRPDFIYYSLRRGGETTSVAYGVADANSRQFGVNQGEIGAFCHLKGYKFQESFDELINSKN